MQSTIGLWISDCYPDRTPRSSGRLRAYVQRVAASALISGTHRLKCDQRCQIAAQMRRFVMMCVFPSRERTGGLSSPSRNVLPVKVFGSSTTNTRGRIFGARISILIWTRCTAARRDTAFSLFRNITRRSSGQIMNARAHRLALSSNTPNIYSRFDWMTLKYRASHRPSAI